MTEEVPCDHHQWIRKLKQRHEVAWKAAKGIIKQYNDRNHWKCQKQGKNKTTETWVENAAERPFSVRKENYPTSVRSRSVGDCEGVG